MSDGGIEEVKMFLVKLFNEEKLDGDFIICNEEEVFKVFLLCFVVVGVVVCY